MNRRFRLTRSTDFQRVRRLGRSYAHPLVVLIALPNPDGRNRFGVAAGKTLGKAVQRNRAKRLLRAAMRELMNDVQAGWDVILVARRPILRSPFIEIISALAQLLSRAGLVAVANVQVEPREG